MPKEQVTVEDGKYTVVFEDGKLYALRYGEPWRDLTGDKFVYALMCRIQALEAEKAEASTLMLDPKTMLQPNALLAELKFTEVPAGVAYRYERASEPFATIHVDGSFIHTVWAKGHPEPGAYKVALIKEN